MSSGRSGGQKSQGRACVPDPALGVGFQHRASHSGNVAVETDDAAQDGSLNQEMPHTTREAISQA